MRKHLMIALLFLVTCTAFACQSYTSGLQQSVVRADETAAIAALHTTAAAQRAYSGSNSGSYGTFEQLAQGGFLDSRFNSDKPKFKGYVLSMSVETKSGEGSYRVNADPEPPQLGRHFYMDADSGLIHINATQPASASDASLDQ